MSRLDELARRLVVVWGLAAAGCDGGMGGGGAPLGPGPDTYVTPAEPAAVVADIRDHMTRLANLKVVFVGQLAVTTPEAANCYGGAPCAGAESNPAVAAEYARQAPRVARLTELAEAAAAAYELPAAGPDAAADLAALNALEIVRLDGPISVAPASSPNCYYTPCPGDVAAADAENRRHADVVHSLALSAVAEEL